MRLTSSNVHATSFLHKPCQCGWADRGAAHVTQGRHGARATAAPRHAALLSTSSAGAQRTMSTHCAGVATTKRFVGQHHVHVTDDVVDAHRVCGRHERVQVKPAPAAPCFDFVKSGCLPRANAFATRRSHTARSQHTTSSHQEHHAMLPSAVNTPLAQLGSKTRVLLLAWGRRSFVDKGAYRRGSLHIPRS